MKIKKKRWTQVSSTVVVRITTSKKDTNVHINIGNPRTRQVMVKKLMLYDIITQTHSCLVVRSSSLAV